MIICISGLSGTGKNTAGEILAKQLGYRQIQFTFKDEAKARGVPLMELQKLADKNPALDKEFDERLVREAAKGNCVVTTWLGPWMVKNAGLRVWLYANDKTRAARISGRDRMTEKEALKHLHARDDDNRKRYKKYYGIDLDDVGFFDLHVNSGKFTPEEIAGIMLQAVKGRGKVF